MTVRQQVERLANMGVADLAGMARDEFTGLAEGLDAGIVGIHPALVSPSRLAPLLRHGDQSGFVVEDMTDLDDFTAIAAVQIPQQPLYVLRDVDGGADLLDWTPNAAVPELLARGRSPLTISEGICWLLQEPDRLEANPSFMCAGSRKSTVRGMDARTPAIWISRGTGRDGRTRRNAPKVGWCWAGNHHTWLGLASTSSRS